MPEFRIAAESRTEFGKGAARRLRRGSKVPAVLYGHGNATTHVSLPEHDLMLALKHPNVLLELDLESGKQLALPKAVQRDPVRLTLEHVDLVIVTRGERVSVEVPLRVTGTPGSGGILDLAHTTINVEASATAIPSEIVVDLDRAEPGTAVHAGDLALSDGVTLLLDPETLVVHVLAPQAEVVEAEVSEGAEGEAETPAEAATAEEA
ncbi:MAG TPA: 50S ribosomal protein L25/general stress protein Ctc [Actinomycetes bacterium]|nr:50S ribosomal protein L25/general stress protein Ctc [Actinomycetes bacterium]